MAEERCAEGADRLKFCICQGAWREFVELFGSPQHTGSTLGIEKADDALDLNGLGRQCAARALARCLVDFPAFSDQTEEAALVTEGGLNGVMREIMQSKMRGVCGLFLPSGGPPVCFAISMCSMAAGYLLI